MDALLVGLHLAAGSAEPERAEAAREALRKIASALPAPEGPPGRDIRELCGPRLPDVAEAVHRERVLRLTYADSRRVWSERRVWPVQLQLRGAAVLLAWCEAREEFRHFRLDRVAVAEATEEPTPRRRRELLADWEARGELEE